ncbi:LysR family transcriptional regulator [Soonwooa sp.]|uniref:LysR family transcriptional regulator n=1 Tax=Soonwooa sp. TaxID=1938592 RepID=UPI00263185FB|nr:LysR family transcriptional regulator [Soonwooa sp.]
MDINQLKSYRTIVEKGNFQDAANELNYSLSAISYQIQQLEHEVKFPLFEKVGRRMLPTERSLKLIPHIRKIEEEIEQIRLLSADKSELKGTLTISVSDSLLTYIIQPVLKEFLETAPDVNLKLKVRNCYDIQKEVIKNEIDLGVHFHVYGYDSQIAINELVDFEIGIIGSPNLPKAEMDFDKKGQRKKVNVIYNDPNGVYQGYMQEYLKKRNIQTRQNIELWSIEAIKKSVMNHLGIACLPTFVFEEELKTGEIVKIPIKDFNPKITMIAAHHQQKWVSPAMQLFLDILERKMKEL